MNKMMLYGGMLLIIIAIILGAVRYSGSYDFGVTYGTGNGWYFYGLVGIIGLIGIVLAIWAYMKKTEPAKT
ncbi:hypothetical protein COS86_04155 [Candidatus Bathyarchaeota archaeon CG07_land_8_20_14_0_80_47_9]|nr:MAG: hypothetical protein COS86_04155 [Candidatus Bathyarchaeota archaeon CG07_land_8_20_14_0_80_47_9]